MSKIKWNTNKYRNWYRSTSSFLSHYLGGLYHRTDEHHIFLMASGLAFSLIVCIIPLILIVFAVLGMILEGPTIKERIELFIDTAIPYADYARVIKDIVFARVEEFVGGRHIAGMVGGTGLVLAATSLFSSMRTTLNRVYNIRTKESLWLGKLRDLGLILLVMIFFLLSIAILPAIRLFVRFTYKSEFLAGIMNHLPEGLLFHLISGGLVFISFLIVYAAVPQQRPRIKTIIVGAFWASILWMIAQQLFGFYVTHFLTMKRIYGTYALFVAVGFWIYYSAIVFIIGAEIGQLYKERRTGASSSGKSRT